MLWACSESQNTVQSHLRRMRVAFSKRKHKKVGELASCMEELYEILGWSERRVLRASKRTSPGFFKTFKKTREQAKVVYTALEHHWKCNGSCQSESHKAYINLGGVVVPVGMGVMFPPSDGETGPCRILQQVRIVPAEVKPAEVKPADAKAAASANDIGHVHHLSSLASAQQGFIQWNTAATARNQNLRTTLPDHPLSTSPRSIRSMLKKRFGRKTRPSMSPEKGVKFSPRVSVLPADSPGTTPSCTPDPSAQSASPQLIEDFCLFLGNDQVKSGAFGVGMDSYFRLNKLDLGLRGVAPDKLMLVTLPELVDAHYNNLFTISRQTQYEIAANTTSALLKASLYPWLSARWSRSDFFFLVDMGSSALCSTRPLFSRSFHPSSSSTASSNQSTGNAVNDMFGQPNEEDTRASLSSLGVVLLELIFGHSIVYCDFWNEYCGIDNKPNDQTEICTARRWAEKVEAESGPDVASVIWRCLEGSFGTRPSFADVGFCESVYENAVKPLMDCHKMNWWSTPQGEWRN